MSKYGNFKFIIITITAFFVVGIFHISRPVSKASTSDIFVQSQDDFLRSLFVPVVPICELDEAMVAGDNIVLDDNANADVVENADVIEQEVVAPQEDALVVTVVPIPPVVASTGNKPKTSNTQTVTAPQKTKVSAPVKQSIAGGNIGKPGKILAETRMVDGKRVCGNKNDKPKKSSKNAKGHIDGECCLDPGETPNSRCYYPPAKYGKLIQKYLNAKK